MIKTLIIACLLVCSISYSQIKISGTIIDVSKVKIAGATILLKDSLNTRILKYTHSKENGNYFLKTNKIGNLNLIFSSLGYGSKEIKIFIEPNQSALTINVTLKEKSTNLEEITIKGNLPIIVSNDTIKIKTKNFVDGTEQTVEELLKKIPGVQVSSDGTIKVGNKEIEKLMIDGDDLFEKGYKILSKNMPAYPINEVEILKKYSNNRLLKGIEESNKVALNLKLDEKSKRVWFGNSETSIGTDKFYEGKVNLMNFGKKNKYYFLTNLNNIGYDATGSIDDLIRFSSLNSVGSVGNNRHAQKLLHLSAGSLGFKKSRIHFNDSKLVSLNAIFNPTLKIKIKPMVFLNWDTTSSFKNSSNTVSTNQVNFTNKEAYKLKQKKRIAFGKINVTANVSKIKMIESSTKFNYGVFSDDANLVFNNQTTKEEIQHKNMLLDQKIMFTNKFKENKVFLFTGRFIHEKSPQNYGSNKNFYEELFSKTKKENEVAQKVKNQMLFFGLNGHLINRKENGNLLELQVGNEFREDKLESDFSIVNKDFVLETPKGYQNNVKYSVNEAYVKSKYQLSVENLKINGNIDLYAMQNKLTRKGLLKSQNPFFVNPSIAVNWAINEKNRLNVSYSYKTTNANIIDVYDNYIQTGSRSFSKGTGEFNQLNTSNLLFNYQLGNWSDRFFASTMFMYNKNFDFFSNNCVINKNFTQINKIIIKDRKELSMSSKVEYYFKEITSNLKVNFEYSKSNYKNVINNTDLREVEVDSYNYGIALRSGFKKMFNYHLGIKWLTNTVEVEKRNNPFTNNESFLDLSFVFNNNFNLGIQTERYFFGNLNKKNNTYYFLDFETRYTLKKDKLSLSLIGKNVFDTRKFINFSASDIGTSTKEYRLLPRHVMLKLEYRF